jgi:S-formylglutathione hydrolase
MGTLFFEAIPRPLRLPSRLQISLTPGAGFYINATNDKWSKNYNMYNFVVTELRSVLEAADLGLVSGHMSMGSECTD